MCANEWMILDGIISVKLQYLKTLNFVQTKLMLQILKIVCQQMSSGLFKNVTYKLFAYKPYIYI